MNREEAEKILQEFVESESLRRHCRSVASSMEHFAKKNGEDAEKWYVTGLLHDFDYEKWPEEHPLKGEPILRERGVGEDVIRAILGHGNHTDVTRDSLMERMLFAVDELSGFVVAVSQVRPDGMNGMKVKSVKKKLKTNGFAAAVSRQDIQDGADEVDMPLEDLIAGVIEALQNNAELLGIKN